MFSKEDALLSSLDKNILLQMLVKAVKLLDDLRSDIC